MNLVGSIEHPGIAGQTALSSRSILSPSTGSCTPQVLDTDEAAFKVVSRPTLFYLPHCPASMSHNLVAANWLPATLPRLALMGSPPFPLHKP